ncbi:hypothetical protein PspLS_04373 [Pyricularia sp. CBS 133598]|nr:hypothetical protein PspLS_04373 [Pyricularia sp. CBS 133598]
MEASPPEPLSVPSGSEACEPAVLAAAAPTRLGPLPPSSNDPQPPSLAAAVLTSGPGPEGPAVEDHAAAERSKQVPAINHSKLADLLRAAKQLPDRGSQLGRRMPDRPLEEARKLPHRPVSEDYWKHGDELLPHLAEERGQSLAKHSSAARGRRGSIKDPNYGRLSPPGDIGMRDWRDERQKYIQDALPVKNVPVKREISQSPPQVGKPPATTSNVFLPTTKLSLECQKRGFNLTTEPIYANEWIAKHEAAVMGLDLARCLPSGKVSRGEGKLHAAQVQTMETMSGAYRQRSPLRGTDVPDARGRADVSRSREPPRARSQSPKRVTKADSSGFVPRFWGDY